MLLNNGRIKLLALKAELVRRDAMRAHHQSCFIRVKKKSPQEQNS
jgi:hypothetical protein